MGKETKLSKRYKVLPRKERGITLSTRNPSKTIKKDKYPSREELMLTIDDVDKIRRTPLGIPPKERVNNIEEPPYMDREEFKKGGIYIKPQNKGKFTDYCGGKVTEECIQKGLRSPNPVIRKRANFARNARRWNKKQGGGFLDILGSAIPAVANIANTVGGMSLVNKVRTDQKPILVKPVRTPYKSTLDKLLEVNTGAYTGMLNSTNPNIGNNAKSLMFSKLLQGNTAAAMEESRLENTFNARQDEVINETLERNASLANTVQLANINRYNQKLGVMQGAIQSGTEGLLGGAAQMMQRNMDSKAMMLEFLKTADTGTLERVSKDMGYDSIEEFLRDLNSPFSKLGRSNNTDNSPYKQGLFNRLFNRKRIKDRYFNPAPDSIETLKIT